MCVSMCVCVCVCVWVGGWVGGVLKMCVVIKERSYICIFNMRKLSILHKRGRERERESHLA